jgi:hypothetical protein
MVTSMSCRRRCSSGTSVVIDGLFNFLDSPRA